MIRVIISFFTLSAATLVAQDTTTPDQQIADLKTQLQTEHEHVLRLEESIQQLQREMSELRTRKVVVGSTSAQAPMEVSTPPLGSSTNSNSDQASIRIRGVTLTPGGFFDATGIYRTRNQNADAVSTFANIPFSGTANSNLSEFRGTARETRLFLLAEGKLKNAKASGYAEIDFEGAAPTANEIESNSFQPRSRQLWAQVEFENGLSISGGQTWSLLTTNRKGLALRQEWVPNTIDLQYVVGYNWARQWSIRVTKNFNDYGRLSQSRIRRLLSAQSTRRRTCSGSTPAPMPPARAAPSRSSTPREPTAFPLISLLT